MQPIGFIVTQASLWLDHWFRSETLGCMSSGCHHLNMFQESPATGPTTRVKVTTKNFMTPSRISIHTPNYPSEKHLEHFLCLIQRRCEREIMWPWYSVDPSSEPSLIPEPDASSESILTHFFKRALQTIRNRTLTEGWIFQAMDTSHSDCTQAAVSYSPLLECGKKVYAFGPLFTLCPLPGSIFYLLFYLRKPYLFFVALRDNCHFCEAGPTDGI